MPARRPDQRRRFRPISDYFSPDRAKDGGLWPGPSTRQAAERRGAHTCTRRRGPQMSRVSGLRAPRTTIFSGAVWVLRERPNPWKARAALGSAGASQTFGISLQPYSGDGGPVISSFGSRCARRFGARCRESRRPRPGWRRAVRAVVRAPARPARYGEFCDTRLARAHARPAAPPRTLPMPTGPTRTTPPSSRPCTTSTSRCGPPSNGLRFCPQTLLFRWPRNATGGRR